MRPKLCLVTSNLFFAEVFLASQIRSLEHDYTLTVIVNTDETKYREAIGGGAGFFNAGLERAIRPFQDLRSLFNLVRLFRKERFDIVHSTTPKAGLLTMVAARLVGISVRIHTFTGQVWQTKTGFMRQLLKATDKITARCATKILVDGKNQYDFLREHGVIDLAKASVLGNGSICGVNVDRFVPDLNVKLAIKREIGMADSDLLIVYMARLTVDKGALVMPKAIAEVLGDETVEFPKIHLLMIGPDEEDLTPKIREIMGSFGSRLHMLGYTRTPERYLAAADIFCLPSYREGFPMVLLNAASCGVASVASRIHGSTDAIEENVTGVFHEPGDHLGLADQIRSLALDPERRRSLGASARSRVKQSYSEAAVTEELRSLYRHLAAAY